MKQKILIVDDEQPNLRALVRLFSEDYEPFAANSGAEAVELLAQHEFAVIISDQRMPEMSGLDFLKKAAQFRPQTVRILLTGYTDVDTLVEAINCGAVYKFVTKPWSNTDLLQLIKRALEHFEAIKKGHGFNHDIHRLNHKLEAAKTAVVSLLSENLELRSAQLREHADRISTTARTISNTLPFEESQTELTATAALLFPVTYDASRIPDILVGAPVADKDLPGRCRELEEALTVINGLRVLEEFGEIGDIIRFANEHFDGTGFPNRLEGESIPLASRILSAVRGYDLLTKAPLSEFGLTHDRAIEHMLDPRTGGVYDPSIVELLDQILPKNEISEVVFAPDPFPSEMGYSNSLLGVR